MPRPANTYRAARRNEAKAQRTAERVCGKNGTGYRRRTVGQYMRPVPNVWPRKGA